MNHVQKLLFGMTVAGAAEGQDVRPLSATEPLTTQGDLAELMVAGIDAFLTEETGRAVAERARFWKRDTSSRDSYVSSIAVNRQRLKRIIGVADERGRDGVLGRDMTWGGLAADRASVESTAIPGRPPAVGEGNGFRMYRIRWRVLRKVEGEGLLLEPNSVPVANVVALPDCDQTPEMLTGLEPGIPEAAQFARRLAESGCRVVVPMLIDRSDTLSGIPRVRMTNQPHR